MITENIRLGYACINMTLQKTKEKITCNRGMIKRTFLKKGINYASELALKNCKDLEPIIRWNHQKGIKVFRMTSCLFPWASEYNLTDLPDYVIELLNETDPLMRGSIIYDYMHPVEVKDESSVDTSEVSSDEDISSSEVSSDESESDTEISGESDLSEISNED